MKNLALALFFVLLFSTLSFAQQEFPEPIGFVNDFADMFSPEDEVKIDALLQELEANTTAEVVVVTVESLHGLTRERYAYDLATEWKIGKKATDNGLLFLIAKNDQQYYFAVGKGLEGSLNDAKVGRIGREVVVPAFKEEEYSDGAYDALVVIGGHIKQD